MPKRENHYERIILLVAALAALGTSGWLIFQSTSFANGLVAPSFPVRHDFGEIPMENVENALTTLTATFVPWKAPIRSNKAVPLNKSVLLVLKDDQIYDLALEDKLLRPPMSNKFLRDYDLDFLSPNVGDLDTDGDGFSNLEEFQKGTNPRDPKSHPPVTDKLYFVQRISHDYLILLKGSGSDPYQVTLTFPDKTHKGYFVGASSPEFGPEKQKADQRFLFVKFEPKSTPDPKTGSTKDISEMTVKDRLRHNELILVKDVPQNLAEYDAKFDFRLGNISDSFTVKKGDNFRLKGYADTTYKVIDILEDSAVISPIGADGTPGREIIIKKA